MRDFSRLIIRYPHGPLAVRRGWLLSVVLDNFFLKKDEAVRDILIGLRNDEHGFVVVGNCELADFIEDYLGDYCALPYDYRTTTQRPGGEIITLYFPASMLLQEIEDSIGDMSRLAKLR